MTRFLDLTGMRFGRLLVIRLSDNRAKDRCLLWTCMCDCGNVIETRGYLLRNHKTQSCGCLAKEITSERSKLSASKASFNNLYYKYKESARLRDIEFLLEKDKFKELTSKPCHYCGIEPLQISSGHTRMHGQYIHNGLDRIDSSLGYREDNVVPCCKTCNYAKRSMSESEFIAWIRRVYEHTNRA